MKRAVFGFSGGSFVFRISRPGVDVDAATPDGLLLHEGNLFSQAIQFGYVANPGAATIVDIPVPSGLGTQVYLLFAYDFGGMKAMPAFYTYGTGSPARAHQIFWVITANQLRVAFSAPPAFTPGAYYILARKE